MRKIFLLLMVFFLSGCLSLLALAISENVPLILQNGYPTSDTLLIELSGRHDYKTLVKPYYGARFIGGFISHATINEVIDKLRPQILAGSDIDTLAKASIIDGDGEITILPYYREKNVICFSYIIKSTRKGIEYKTADKAFTQYAQIEYDSNTGKIVRENISEEEANEKRGIFMKDNLNRATGGASK